MDKELYDTLIRTTTILKELYEERIEEKPNILAMSAHTYSFFSFNVMFNGLSIVIMGNMPDFVLEVRYNNGITSN